MKQLSKNQKIILGGLVIFLISISIYYFTQKEASLDYSYLETGNNKLIINRFIKSTSGNS